MSSKYSGGSKNKKRRKTQTRSGEPKEDNTFHDMGEKSPNIEENDDLFFCSEEGFSETAKHLAAVDWVKVCKSLLCEVAESVADLEGDEPELCARCEELIIPIKIMASNQLRGSHCALREYSRRYSQALGDLSAEKEEKKEMVAKSLAIGEELEERLCQLAEEKRETEQERNRLRTALATRAEEKREMEMERSQLRAALAARTVEKEEAETERNQLRAALASREEGEREGRAPPPRDTQPEEAEMREETPSPSSSDATISTILGALEGWFEEKWGQMVSQLTPPLNQGERGGSADR